MTDLDALLRETRWLERVARALTRDGAAADDLRQDVLVEALRKPPREGADPRGWLALVARRLAGRGRERESASQRAEASAARPEAQPSHDARLQLHRTLGAAIARLADQDRELIVERYLDERTPREMAAARGVDAVVLRKRLSRALARLRAEMDEDTDARRALAAAPWLHRRPEFAAAGAVLAIGAGAKIMIGVAAALLLAATLQLGRSSSSALTSGASLTPDPAPADSVDELGMTDAQAGHRTTIEAGLDPVPSIATVAEVARIRVIDSQGRPLPRARVAWLHETLDVTPIELNADGTADRPDESAGRLFVAADGFVHFSTRVRLPGDVVAELAPAQRLQLHVTVDGGPPVERVPLRLFVSSEDRPVDEAPVVDELESLGVIAPSVLTFSTDVDGHLDVRVPSDEPSWMIGLPRGYAIAPEDRGLEEKVSVNLPVTDDVLQLELCSLPSIRGRIVWNDDGTPLGPDLRYVAQDAEGHTSALHGTMVSPIDGAFRITIPTQREMEDPIALRITHGDARFAGGFEHVIALPTDLPLDLGTLRVDRPTGKAVRVMKRVGEDLMPLKATVFAPADIATTDAQGRAVVRCEPGAWIGASSPGHLFDRALCFEDETLIVLEPGPTLLVHVPFDSAWPDGVFDPSIRLDFERDAFANEPLREETGSYSYDVVRATWGGAWRSAGHDNRSPSGPSHVILAAPRSKPLVVHDLRPGAAITVSWIDLLGQTIESRQVKMPEKPVEFVVDLRKAAYAGLRATLRVEGCEPEGRSVFALSAGDSGRRGTWFDGPTFLAAPLARGTYDLIVRTTERRVWQQSAIAVETANESIVIDTWSSKAD